MEKKFDVIIIGAGPAGYVAAIRCAQLGLKTACIDQWLNDKDQPALGGTCLNVGCVPSKVLLESSELFEKINNQSVDHGITVTGAKIDVATMMAKKQTIVNEFSQGIMSLFKSNGVTFIQGRAQMLSGLKVEVCKQEGATARQYQAQNIILATGSSPINITAAPLQDDVIVDSSGALAFTAVPKKIGIIGAGVIGLELGSVWRRLGSEVILLEAQETFLSMADHTLSKESYRQYVEQGLDIRLGARVVSSEIKKGKVVVNYQDKRGSHHETVDKLIVAVGRSPNSKNLAADDVGLMLDEWGFVHVNDVCETALPNVYAIGDLVRGPMLAHKGSDEGMMVAEKIAGNFSEIDYDIIPSVIYTTPEVAWLGKTEHALKAAGENYVVGSFPMAANSRARAHHAAKGMVKVIAHAETDRILGVHIVGPFASELIMQAVIAIEFGASSEDIGLMMFAHPTVSEAFREAALDVAGNAIHIARKKKSK